MLVWALAGVLTATTPKRSQAVQERFLIAARQLLGDVRRLRKNCFFGALILKSKFDVGQRQGAVGPVATGRRRWLEGVTVPGADFIRHRARPGGEVKPRTSLGLIRILVTQLFLAWSRTLRAAALRTSVSLGLRFPWPTSSSSSNISRVIPGNRSGFG